MKVTRHGRINRVDAIRKTLQFEALEDRSLLSTITGLDFIPDAINNLGHVIGSTRTSSSYLDGYPASSVFWTPTGGDKALDFNATGLNDSDKVIGDQLLVSSQGGVYGFQTAVWTPSGGDQLLPNFPDNYNVSINNSDYVTGEEVPQAGLGPANIYVVDNLDTGKVGIPPFSENIHFVPFPMNNAGDYAGYIDPDSQGGTSGFVASLANPGQVITTLQGSISGPADQLDGNINAINDSNQVVGEVANQAVIWNGGTLTNLGFLSAGDTSSAEAITDSGVVVGDSGDRAFLWSKATGMIDLNTFLPANSGWFLEQATGINNQGQIVGYGTDNGNPEGFVLNINTSTAVGVNWDPATGNVDFAYVNGVLTQPPQITFAWSSTPTLTAQSTRIAGTIDGLTGTGEPYIQARPGSDFAASPPPTGTHYLLMLDTVGTNTSVVSVPYAPTITVTDAEGATAGEIPSVFGRFFSTVSNPGESFQVAVSNDLAVLTATSGGVVAQLNGVFEALTLTSPGHFTTPSVDTGQLKADATLLVTASAGSTKLATATNYLEVYPLPEWLTAIPNLMPVFKNGTYTVAAKLVDLHTSASPGFALPAAPGLWLGAGFESGVDAYLNVGVVTTLNPLVKPSLAVVQGGGSVTFLGSQFASLPATVIPLSLDPRTLALLAPTISYSASGSGSPSLFGNKTFTLAPLNIMPNLTAAVNYGVILTVTLNADGTLKASESALAFGMDATLTGNLTFDSFTTGNQALDDAFTKLKSFISGANPVKAVISQLVSFLGGILADLGLLPTLPTIAARANVSGAIALAGGVSLQGSPLAPQLGQSYLNGGVLLAVPTADITFNGETAFSTNLGGFLNLVVPI
jgi:uncharacterized lipoprotein NlpE involved in copper resistance